MRKTESNYTVAQVSEDLTLKIWDSRIDHPARTISTGPNIPQAVDVSGDYAVIAHNGFNGEGCEIQLFDQRTDKIVKILTGHKEAVNSVSYIKKSGGRLLVSCSKDQTVKLWSVQKSTPLYSTSEKYGSVFCVSSSGDYVLAGNIMCYLMVYTLDEAHSRLELKSIL